MADRWPDIDAYLKARDIRIGPPRSSQTTGGTHAAGSYHYQGLARDYGDLDSDCRAVVTALLPFAGRGGPIVELFYAPTNTWLKNGEQLSRAAVGDHDDHAHAAIARDRMLPAGHPARPASPKFDVALLVTVVDS